MGLIDIKTDDRNGPVSCVQAVAEDDHLFVMTGGGQIVRTPASEVSTVGRNTKGVKMMTVEDGDSVVCCDVLPGAAATEE
jgi:DNA gyrase subunit A